MSLKTASCHSGYITSIFFCPEIHIYTQTVLYCFPYWIIIVGLLNLLSAPPPPKKKQKFAWQKNIIGIHNYLYCHKNLVLSAKTTSVNRDEECVKFIHVLIVGKNFSLFVKWFLYKLCLKTSVTVYFYSQLWFKEE